MPIELSNCSKTDPVRILFSVQSTNNHRGFSEETQHAPVVIGHFMAYLRSSINK